MLSYKKTSIVCLLAIVLLCAPLSALAATIEDKRTRKQADPAVMAADLVLVRPLGIVATLAGSAVFIVSIPFSAIGGNTEEAWESLVVSPATYTFKRPLGGFEE
ncbi:MAG: hypothetical protein HKP41_20835 [Desulfobacterales bacterium]|nr:hypothetical protein [Deltaproteobacteria bacterium]MBT8362235.1 hypothetical protein [Deltaproteobacteria bacterium]NNK96805.1 hypothetical protein [Desulfobacterales bacterium]